MRWAGAPEPRARTMKSFWALACRALKQARRRVESSLVEQARRHHGATTAGCWSSPKRRAHGVERATPCYPGRNPLERPERTRFLVSFPMEGVSLLERPISHALGEAEARNHHLTDPALSPESSAPTPTILPRRLDARSPTTGCTRSPRADGSNYDPPMIRWTRCHRMRRRLLSTEPVTQLRTICA
jgi:hypothetical protein